MSDRQRKQALCAGVSLLLLAAAGCASFPKLETPAARTAEQEISETFGAGGEAAGRARSDEVLAVPSAGAAKPEARPPATEEQIAQLVPDEPLDAALPPQALPQFVDAVFGGLLKVPYAVGPEVADRRELVALNTSGRLSKRSLFRLTQKALAEYGVNVYVDGGFVTVGRVGAASGPQPALVRGRTPATGGGRLIQFFEVQTLEANAAQTLLQDVARPSVTVTVDQLSNTLILSGQASDVANAVELLRQIDQPKFSGSRVLRVEPIFWSAEVLGKSLEDVLTAEGYAVSRIAAARRSIVILPLTSANQLLVFTNDPVLFDRVQYWIDKLDRPAAVGDKPSTFVYQVRNTDAQSLGALISGSGSGAQALPDPTGRPGQPPSQTAAANAPAVTSGSFGQGRVVVDAVGNRILFTGTASEFAQLRGLLDTLDRPAPQVLIEVTIAEVTLTDSTRLGLEFFFREVAGGIVTQGGTEGGLGLAAGGLSLRYVGPDVRAAFNAFASNNKVNILSRPRAFARSGGAAKIQVGTDVPIITSQAAIDTQVGGNRTDVLQSVQYRQTGVILDVAPVVYGDRVNLKIAQEVSSQADNPNAAIASPLILNRNITTEVSLQDGATAVLGGLIDNSYTKGNTGIPFLKDVPLVGSAFQTNSVSGAKTELIVLVTPFILNDPADVAEQVERSRRDIDAAFRVGRGWSYTLTPWAVGPVLSGDRAPADRPN